MKIALSMKSNFAYDRLVRDLTQYEIHPQLKTLEEVREVIQYWQPDVMVLDKHLAYFEEAQKILLRFNIYILTFDSDFETAIEDLHTHAAFFTDTDEQQEKYIPDQSKYKKQLKKKPEREEPKQKVIIKKEYVEKEVEKLSFTGIPSNLIVVGSMWAGSGSTTLAINLARAIAKRQLQVSYIEFPTLKPYMFDYLSIDSHETEKRTYVDHFHLLNKKGVIGRDRIWMNSGIQWFVNDSRLVPVHSFKYEQMMKVLYSIKTPITIVDISTHWENPEIQDFLHQADEVFVCVEPDPIKIDWLSLISDHGKRTDYQRPEYETISFLKELEKDEGISFQYITMKHTKGIDQKEWLGCLEKEPLTTIPYIPYEDAIAAVWNSRFLYDEESYFQIFETAFKPIIKRVLPIQFRQINKQDKKPLQKLIGLFQRSENVK